MQQAQGRTRHDLPPNWVEHLEGCRQLIRAWPCPPDQAPQFWIDQLEAQAISAAKGAAAQYDKSLDVPFADYVRLRFLAQALSLYRRAWGRDILASAPICPGESHSEPRLPIPEDGRFRHRPGPDPRSSLRGAW
jgi:hypothetical protein